MDQYQGADSAGLEEKIKQHTENDPGNSEDSDIPKGYVSAERSAESSPKYSHVFIEGRKGRLKQKTQWMCNAGNRTQA